MVKINRETVFEVYATKEADGELTTKLRANVQLVNLGEVLDGYHKDGMLTLAWATTNGKKNKSAICDSQMKSVISFAADLRVKSIVID